MPAGPRAALTAKSMSTLRVFFSRLKLQSSLACDISAVNAILAGLGWPGGVPGLSFADFDWAFRSAFEAATYYWKSCSLCVVPLFSRLA